MRTILTPAMMEVLGRNFSRNIDAVRAFEIGNTFTANLVDPEALPDEQDNLCIGMYGAGADFFYLKGMIVSLLNKLGVKDLQFIAESEYGVYHPGRCARISVKSTKELAVWGDEYDEIGIMGEVHPDVAENYGMDGMRIYCCEIMFDTIIRHANTNKVYKPLPKYPSTSRDIALLVEEDVQVGDIIDVIKGCDNTILEDVKLFDVYRGKQVDEGKKSVAFTLTYRDKDKTLTDEDVAPVHGKVLEALKENINAVLREM
jgi:phenylalanyl-tRNA synthetase beta chain